MGCSNDLLELQRERRKGVNNLKVTISKTADGQSDYMQIMSVDLLSVNIVLVAPKIEVEDARKEKAKK